VRPRIVVTRKIAEPALALLRETGDVWVPEPDRALPTDELHAAIAGADAVVSTLHERVDAAFADAAGAQLKVVATVAVGYDNIDVPALAARGIVVTNTPGVLTDATADLTFGLLLSVTRRFGEGERLLRSRTPWEFDLGFLLGTGIQGKTLGIVGLGQIGTAVARRARAFGMSIVYTGRRRADTDVERELDARYLTLEELLRESDVVSLHCPLTPQTRHLIDADADEAALADALANGVIAGAGLDVFEKEPEVHPTLLELDNVALTPHLGSATRETRTAMAMLAARNAVAVLRGDDPLTPVVP
jgi:glyoxylate reductase